jgi:hypothetical protein
MPDLIVKLAISVIVFVLAATLVYTALSDRRNDWPSMIDNYVMLAGLAFAAASVTFALFAPIFVMLFKQGVASNRFAPELYALVRFIVNAGLACLPLGSLLVLISDDSTAWRLTASVLLAVSVVFSLDLFLDWWDDFRLRRRRKLDAKP